MAEIRYIADTSSLIQLRYYPRSTFPSLWAFIDSLIASGRLIAPREVLRELMKGDDQVLAWAKTRTQMFIDIDAGQAAALTQLLAKYPALADPLKTGPFADPWVVALAVERKTNDPDTIYIVLTDERAKGPGSLKIPNLCKEHEVDCVPLLGLLEAENLTF